MINMILPIYTVLGHSSISRYVVLQTGYKADTVKWTLDFRDFFLNLCMVDTLGFILTNFLDPSIVLCSFF